MMKPIAILILGCVPLAVLTGWSFVELAAIDDSLFRPAAPDDVQAATRSAQQAESRAQAGQRPLTALAETDLLAGQPLEALAETPDPGPWNELGRQWPQWVEAVRTAQAVVEADRPMAVGDLDGLKKAAGQLETLKTKLEKSSLRGTDELLKVVRGRIDEIRSRTARIEQEREAAVEIARARTAFQASEYAQCAGICDEVLLRYSQMLDTRAADEVRALRERAQFRDDARRALADLEKADIPQRRRAVLQPFLDKYPDRGAWTAAEQKILDQCRQDLQASVAKIDAADKEKAAGEAIARLRSELPAGFAERVQRAGEIFDRYPMEACKLALRREVRQWLAELLPEKKIEESPQLQEVETTRREIVRGFFTAVQSPRGYKRYPTYEQSVNPISEVGTYLAKELLGGPAASVPRRCVTRYAAARQQVLDNPHQKLAWQQLAAMCDQLEEELGKYRQKQGASDESLGFAAEAALARGQSASPAWGPLEKLFASSSSP
jgi:hypothetical protein